MVRALSSSESATMFRKIFQLYTVHISGKCVLRNSSSLNMISSLVPHVEQSPHKFTPENFSPMKSFFLKKVPLPHTLGGGGETMKRPPKMRLKAKGTN